MTCPFICCHPAIIAQAAATTALLSDGRSVLGVGAGERLDEHVVGDGWPSVRVRHGDHPAAVVGRLARLRRELRRGEGLSPRRTTWPSRPPCGRGVGRCREVAQQFVDAGFDHLAFANADPDDDCFFADELADPLRALQPSS